MRADAKANASPSSNASEKMTAVVRATTLRGASRATNRNRRSRLAELKDHPHLFGYRGAVDVRNGTRAVRDELDGAACVRCLVGGIGLAGEYQPRPIGAD